MKKKRVFLFAVLGILGLCLTLTALSALTNIGLPTSSRSPDRLSESQKAYIREALLLRQTLGEELWAGWGDAAIPIIVYNESYAFLLGYPDPPDGWVKMPAGQPRGSAWEVVPDDTLDGQAYYRQRLPNPHTTPEAFTVLVGERWVASLPIREFMEIIFYRDFKAGLPSFLQPVFPLRLVWGLIMGSAETYIEALDHEAFHAFQGQTNPTRLAQAETIMSVNQTYPWDDEALTAAWKAEIDLLLAALDAESDEQALQLAQQFWRQRNERREQFNFTHDMAQFERQREWLEGLAKYSELSLGRLAGSTDTYTPLPEIQADPDFSAYTRQAAYWNQQLNEATSSALRSGETRFYYSGFVQAALLDRLAPGWKERVLTTDLALEDLLRELTPIQP